ncbi:3-mercaptopyruvate sulfurtransferase-like [Stegastes partitus]|uniref:Sulfurtransferase n=1 Tax=Stegastes partitus TaxID=144197 RepID=A0A9Y4NHG9_9TELE|nr:PREDICTED: 3-mercaptopyruvate sulfurtransferase-like [Stegastes partitus]
MAAQTRALVSAQWLINAVRTNQVGPKLRVLDASYHLPHMNRDPKAECGPSAESVSVLDGGMRGWTAAGGPLTAESCRPERTDFRATLDRAWVKSYEEVLENVRTRRVQVVDTRFEGRYRGTEPEFRDDVLPGHFPGAINMPFTSFLDEGGKMHGPERLSELFREAGVDLKQPLWATCGSGVTACQVALAAHLLGHPGVCIYDGSWYEFFKKASPEFIISEWEAKKV